MAGQANRIEMEGRLARGELKFTANGIAIFTGSLAYTPRSLDKDTNKWVDKETQWFQIEGWRNQGELLALIPTGLLIQIFGTLRVHYWQGPEGERREKVSITVDRFTIPVISPDWFHVDEDDQMIFKARKKKVAPVNNGIEDIAADYEERPF